MVTEPSVDIFLKNPVEDAPVTPKLPAILAVPLVVVCVKIPVVPMVTEPSVDIFLKNPVEDAPVTPKLPAILAVPSPLIRINSVIAVPLLFAPNTCPDVAELFSMLYLSILPLDSVPNPV